MSHGVQHSSHLTVTSLAQGKFDDPGTALLTSSDQLRVGGGGDFAFANRQALGQRLDRLLGGFPLYGRLIQLAQTLARVGHPVDKVAVVRQQDQPFGVRVQSSGGNQPNAWYPDKVRDLLFRMPV
jgi:hypothetical protein